MDHDLDPFSVFNQSQEVGQFEGKTKKRVNLDPFAQLERQCVSNINPSIQEKDHESEKEGDRNTLEKIEIDVERSESECIHEIYFPKNYQRNIYKGLINKKTFPFKLDPFQLKAMNAIESKESVLVCAHTSSGKTAVAEYAIASSIKSNTKVVYTSPIKTLSNQKYRELKRQFNDVGLITGDSNIDRNSSCLVMTTEILRNMIYRGSEMIKEIQWVIFDEIHYMNDKQRGLVWQETIIMMPENVKYIFLSATINNPQEFASWIVRLRKRPCHVICTDKRPTPLQHFLCPLGGKGVYQIVDKNGTFNHNILKQAIQTVDQNLTIVGLEMQKKKKNVKGVHLAKVIRLIKQRQMDPAIIFSFSKKDVEVNARSILIKYDFTTSQEKTQINEIFSQAIETIEEVDRKLLPITSIKKILEKGIGIHHGGLLPIIKETVEILFQAGLIKILFSTETFSMGINMPTKTVVFTSVRKFDGDCYRSISSSQYTQMSGRAGRRGLDHSGISILMIDEKVQEEAMRNILSGKKAHLSSHFYLTPNMILNSIRMEDIDLDYVLSRTFLQYQNQENMPNLRQERTEKHHIYQKIKLQFEQELEQLSFLKKQHEQNRIKIQKLVYLPQKVMEFMNIGRVVRVKTKDGKVDWGLGFVVNFSNKSGKKKKKTESSFFIVDILVYIKKKQDGEESQPTNFSDPKGQLAVILFTSDCIWEITTIKVELPQNLNKEENQQKLFQTFFELSKRNLNTINLNRDSHEVKHLRKEQQEIENQIKSFDKLNLGPHLKEYQQKKSLYEEIKKLSKEIEESNSLVLKKEKKNYLRVVKKLGLIEKGIVTRKGNVACQISGFHNFLLTELIFSGFFSSLTPLEINGILSSFINEERSKDKHFLKKLKLKEKFETMMKEAKKVSEILYQHKIINEEQDYIASIRQQLVEITYEWCEGLPFKYILQKSFAYEGSIIKAFRRLNELLQQLINAVQIIGNHELVNKFEECRTLVFKGIVQVASLYTC